MRVMAFFLVYSSLTTLVTPSKHCNLPKSLITEIKSHEPVVKKIIDSVVKGKHKGYVYKQLAKFVDKFGPRISGSQALEKSIDYMVKLLKSEQLDNVHTEPVMVPHWIRGMESARLLSPREYNMTLLGLGGSISTPKDGITADAIVVKSFSELKKVNAKGKIVVFNQKFVSYEKTVVYRAEGAVEAAKCGASATLVASITTFSLNTAHTGTQDYEPGVKKIPVAAIAQEDARMLQRMQDEGEKLKIKLILESKHLPDVESRNVIADITGREQPKKIVVVSGHIDSWDVGEGALDDGGGAFISWIALVVLKELKLKPRKTLRSILWTSEETGMQGAEAYAKKHGKDMDDFEIILESDEGTFTPMGLTYQGNDDAACILEEVVRLLKPVNATTLTRDEISGTDITKFKKFGVPLAILLNANDRYLWYHHTIADNMEVHDSSMLDKCAATWAAIAYILADLSVSLPRNDKSVHHNGDKHADDHIKKKKPPNQIHNSNKKKHNK